MNDAIRIFLATFSKSRELGIYGDFLYGVNQTGYGSGPLETLAGPTIGPLLEMGAVHPLNALKNHFEGKRTHLGAQEMRNLKGFVPGNNVWFLKGLTDHLIMQRMMEAVSPGYLSSIRSRTLKDNRQDWWWGPGESAPDRAPGLGKAIER